MTVGILQCGDPPEVLRTGHGSYGSMMQRLLGPGLETTVYNVTAGALPGSATAHGAYLLTGSPAGVYEDLPWIAGLTGFLRQARGRAKLVGICFGHQAMAQAFGGSVVKSSSGWSIGLQRYQVEHRMPWMDGAAHVDAPASHQDQVVAIPPGSRVVLANPFTPNAGLDYGDAISFQFHPEFDAAFGMALIKARWDRYGALSEPAIASYGRPDDCARVAQWIGRFLDAP